MRNRIALALLTVAMAGLVACGDTVVQVPPTAPAPTPLPTAPRSHAIELRVNGSASSARIRYSNSVDGLTQVVTALPFIVETSTIQTTFFLSMDVTPIAFPLFTPAPFMSAQIFVDGILFREATSADTTLSTLSVSGTWRAN